MRNIATTVLSVLLAAAVISIFVLYRQYIGTKNALLVSQKKMSELNEKTIQSNRETSALQEQIRKNADRFKELKNAKEHISQLEDTLSRKDQTLSQLRGKLHRVERNLVEEKKTAKVLKAELTTKEAMVAELENAINKKDLMLSEFKEKLHRLEINLEEERKTARVLKAKLTTKDTMVTELQKRIKNARSHFRLLQDEIARDKSEMVALQRQLSNLEGERAITETKMGQLKSTYEALISDLKNQIGNQKVTIKAFEEKISITFVDRILFDLGKATITPEGRKLLRKVGQTLKIVQDRRIRVIGHTDNTPILPRSRFKFPSNWELSAARAVAVVRHFQEEIGLDPTNMEVVGRSLYDPITNNETEEARTQNRRVNIIIAPTIE